MCSQSGSEKTFTLGAILGQLLVQTTLRMVALDPNSDYVHLGHVNRRAIEEWDQFSASLAAIRARAHLFRGPFSSLSKTPSGMPPIADGSVDRRGDRAYGLHYDSSVGNPHPFRRFEARSAAMGYQNLIWLLGGIALVLILIAITVRIGGQSAAHRRD
jgi:hypothetical protein